MMNGYNALPTTLYDCWVPVVATMTDLDLEYVGLVNPIHNGVEEKPDHTQLSKVKINIDRMIDIYSKGFNIIIINKYQIPNIYHILDTYLQGIDVTNPNIRSLNKPSAVDPRLDTIKRFMVAIMEKHNIPIIKYDSAKQPSGFDLGFNRLENVVRPQNQHLANTNTQPIGGVRKRIGGRAVTTEFDIDQNKLNMVRQDNISLLNDSINIDLNNFNFKEYKKGMM